MLFRQPKKEALLSVIIYVDHLPVLIQRKKVKNLNLTIRRNGEIVLSVPYHCSLYKIDAWLQTRKEWIYSTLKKIENQSPTLQWVSGEKHYLWGEVYTLMLDKEISKIECIPEQCTLKMPSNNIPEKRQVLLDAYYANCVAKAVDEQLLHHVVRMNTPLPKITVRKMKTRWGSCTPSKGTIRMNSELAKYPPQCLEYVLVHELAHFHQRGHGEKFIALMDYFLPDWRKCRALLKKQFVSQAG